MRRAVAVHIGKVAVGCTPAFTVQHVLPCFDQLSKVKLYDGRVTFSCCASCVSGRRLGRSPQLRGGAC